MQPFFIGYEDNTASKVAHRQKNKGAEHLIIFMCVLRFYLLYLFFLLDLFFYSILFYLSFFFLRGEPPRMR